MNTEIILVPETSKALTKAQRQGRWARGSALPGARRQYYLLHNIPGSMSVAAIEKKLGKGLTVHDRMLGVRKMVVSIPHGAEAMTQVTVPGWWVKRWGTHLRIQKKIPVPPPRNPSDVVIVNCLTYRHCLLDMEGALRNLEALRFPMRNVKRVFLAHKMPKNAHVSFKDADEGALLDQFYVQMDSVEHACAMLPQDGVPFFDAVRCAHTDSYLHVLQLSASSYSSERVKHPWVSPAAVRNGGRVALARAADALRDSITGSFPASAELTQMPAMTTPVRTPVLTPVLPHPQDESSPFEINVQQAAAVRPANAAEWTSFSMQGATETNHWSFEPSCAVEDVMGDVAAADWNSTLAIGRTPTTPHSELADSSSEDRGSDALEMPGLVSLALHAPLSAPLNAPLQRPRVLTRHNPYATSPEDALVYTYSNLGSSCSSCNDSTGYSTD